MTPLRNARWFATMITFVAAFAWLLASNHCAIAAMEAPVKAEHVCCHENEPARPAPSTQCCEAFNVPIPDQAAAPVGQLHELKPAWLAAVTEIFASQGAVAPIACETGPPRAVDALQVLLSRCLPAHAPPDFVV
ncbi:MAG: hypothetical protein ACREKL_09920 [Chthoniobacterales bacterium]